jgi:hypothetical protein
MRCVQSLVWVAGLALVAPAVLAQTGYKIEPIVAEGDTVGGLKLSGPMGAPAFNDQGQAPFLVSSGGLGQCLFFYDAGALTPIVVGGREAPGGVWPKNNDLRPPAINAHGSLVFASMVTIGSATSWGVFRWEPKARKIAPVALPQMPATSGLTFARSGKPEFPAINNQDEVAFSLFVEDAAGKAQMAAFFLGADGKLLPIALPGQALPGGATMQSFAGDLSLNDAGMVAFRARRQGDRSAASAYVWEKGTITPVAVVGQAAPGGGTITRVSGVWTGNKDRSLLVAAVLSTNGGRVGLYRFVDGLLTPLVTPGQQVTTGVTIQSIPEHDTPTGVIAVWNNVSRPNEAGQYLFIGPLEGGGFGIFRLEPGAPEAGGGKVSLVLRIPGTTVLGEVTGLPAVHQPCLNSRGQVIVPVRIDGRPETVVLLTPQTP